MWTFLFYHFLCSALQIQFSTPQKNTIGSGMHHIVSYHVHVSYNSYTGLQRQVDSFW